MEFEPDKRRSEHAETSEEIIDLLIREVPPARIGFSEHLHLLDMQQALQQLAFDEHRVGSGPYPVLRLANNLVIPMTIDYFRWITEGFPHLPNSFYEFMESGETTLFNGIAVEAVTYNHAVDMVRSLAKKFLELRMSVVRQFEKNQKSFKTVQLKKHLNGSYYPTPVCNVTFKTKTKGLRVLRQGAYLMVSPTPVVGAPTTPLSCSLPPGAYVFGVDQGPYGNSEHWDRAGYTVPTPHAITLNF